MEIYIFSIFLGKLSICIVMDCFDVSLALHSLIGASLIVAGVNLMMVSDSVTRGYGAYAFALGYLIIGVVASEHDVANFDFRSKRYLLGLGSATLVITGTYMNYYHVQEAVKKALSSYSGEHPIVVKDIVKSVPMFDNILIYSGYIGLVLAISWQEESGSINWVRLILASCAFLAIGYTKDKIIEASVSGQELKKYQLGHMLSWSLLVVAMCYSC